MSKPAGSRRIDPVVSGGSKSPLKLVALITAILVVPGSWLGLAALGLPVAGITLFEKDSTGPGKQVQAQAAVADFSQTPAADVFRNTLAKLDKTWTPSPVSTDSAGLPHPLDCVKPSPTLSTSKAYTAENKDLQVTLAAYPAGLGGAMFKRLETQLVDCKPAGTAVFGFAENNVGVQARTVQVTWGGNAIQTTYFRRGDVIGFVSTNRGDASVARAKVVDSALAELMAPNVCVDLKASAQESLRNATFAKDRFSGKRQVYEIFSDALPLPKLSPEQVASRTPAVTIPAQQIFLEKVERPSDVAPYPLWPELPEPMKLPKMPKDPKPQKLDSKTSIRVPDLQGPGCGWSFLATAVPDFDQKAVEANNEKFIDDAQTVLDADGPRWQKDVQAYWSSYASYLTKVDNYRAYEQQVKTVARAWRQIRKAWDAYYTDYANWQQSEAERKGFIARKAQAAKDFEAAKQACVVYEQNVAAYPPLKKSYDAALKRYEQDLAAYEARVADADPANDGEPPVKPTPPAVPTEPATGCPPERPAILDEKAPEAQPEPSQPADPRPAGERD